VAARSPTFARSVWTCSTEWFVARLGGRCTTAWALRAKSLGSCERRMKILCFFRKAWSVFFFFQAEDGIRDDLVTGVQTCALPILGYVGSSISPRALETRRRGDPKDKIALYNLMKQAALDSVEGRLDEGIAKVRRALAADPEIVEAYLMLGNMNAKAKRPKESLEAYQKALALDPDNQTAAFSLALAYKTDGKNDAAEAGFERVLALNPRDSKARYQLTDIWMRRGEFERAEAALKRAVADNVESPAFLTEIGECYIEMKRYDEAERSTVDALKDKAD